MTILALLIAMAFSLLFIVCLFGLFACCERAALSRYPWLFVWAVVLNLFNLSVSGQTNLDDTRIQRRTPLRYTVRTEAAQPVQFRPNTHSFNPISGERRALAMRVEAAGINQPATDVTAGETAINPPRTLHRIVRPDGFQAQTLVSNAHGTGGGPITGSSDRLTDGGLPCGNTTGKKLDFGQNDSGPGAHGSREILNSPSNFLQTLSKIESGGNPGAIGKRGERGLFQMSAVAWEEVSRIRAAQGLPLFPFEMAHEPGVAKEHAIQYLAYLSNRFSTAHHGLQPTERQLIGLWQHGFRGMQRRGFFLKGMK